MNNQPDDLDRNFDAFQSLLPTIVHDRRGEFALLRDAKMVDLFDSLRAALAGGHHRFPDGRFSVQEVTDRPADLGFFSHAVDSRIA